MARPNLLLIHSDQHRFDCLGCNGHPLVQTPNLDRLAAEGVRCTHAFTPSPISSPARASLVSGQWPTQHGVISIPHTELYHPPAREMPVFPHLLHQAGYRLTWIGKYHGELAGPPTEHGVHEYVPGSAYEAWRKEQGLPPRPRRNSWFGEPDPGVRPAQSRLAWGADRILERLEQFAAGKQPFFLRWDPTEPHLPNVVPEPYASMYHPDTVPPWPSFPDDLADKPYIQKQQRRTWRLEGWPWEKWAPIVARYLGEITLLDAQVGRILAALDRLGLAQNTLVVYTTDHGDLCGGHGMIDKNYVMYDEVTRVPLLLRWPAALPAGQVCDAFVSHEIDLASTFCAAAGVPIPPTFMGRSLLASALGHDPAPRPDIFGQWQGAQFGAYSQRMVRDRRWKYIWNPTAEDELYDLPHDPGECRNLARQPAAAAELRRLRARLIEWMQSVQDPLCNAWTKDQLENGLKL